MAANEKTQKAIDHLKSHQTLYTLLTMISALLGMYLDYRTGIAELESKSSASETEQIEQDLSLQKNLKFVYDRNLSVENRLTRLEVEMEGVKESNRSLLSYFFHNGAGEEGDRDHDGFPDIEEADPSSSPPASETHTARPSAKKTRPDRGEEGLPAPFHDFEGPEQKKLDLSPPQRHFP